MCFELQKKKNFYIIRNQLVVKKLIIKIIMEKNENNLINYLRSTFNTSFR